MQPLLHMLTIVVLLALLVLSLLTLSTHVRFLRRLRQNHETTWRELGQPSTFWPGMRRMRYAHWMWFRGFDELQDPELAALGSRVMGAAVVAIVLVLAFLVCAVFAGDLTWR
jgi:disulfide bond formation protein DsbB